MKQAILTTLMLNFFEDLMGRFEDVLHTLAFAFVKSFGCCKETGDFNSQERAAPVAFPTEGSSPIAVVSASQGAELGTHCSALLQGTAPAEEMDPLIQDK